ncbi:MAG: ATP-binding protein [Gammaproteobacteria bacterium]|jgi:two-component system, OmpR family, sensor histidine kinase PhoQ|nr:ATP-binding protein [Gammaproteobacteria bacterium]
MSHQTNSQTKYSLQHRLVLAFGILLILFLGLTGLVLNQAFQESIAASVEERLQLQVYAVLGVAEPDTDMRFFVPDLEEARFSQIDSGLYAFIFNQQANEVWRSPSAVNMNPMDLNMAGPDITPGQMIYGSAQTEEQGPMSFASYGTYWSGLDQEFSFVVMESVAPTDAEINEFQSNLRLWLGGLAIFLSLAQFALLRWSMTPLKRLAQDLAEIEAGNKEQLGEDYPSELHNLSNNMNMLIQSERQRQTKYRTTLGDLAHSLKTPLAVISGVVQQDRKLDKKDMVDVSEQVDRMNQIVSYQLNRATKTSQSKMLASPVLINPVVEKICGALNKVYLDKKVHLEVSVSEKATFYGEASDLTELLGNLMDNAYKYCQQQVHIRIQDSDKSLQIEIDDDGLGIAEQDRHWVLERGARADSRESGQGIGLAVALDIISSYGGELKVESSALGGASFLVTLKAA